jgi:intracellular septation protein
MNPQLRRLLLDLGPILIFVAAFIYFAIGHSVNDPQVIIRATVVFMPATVIALAAGWIIEKKIPPVPLATAVLVVIFGGLTVYLNDATFIKMKPTVLYALFGIILIGGLAFKRLYIKYVFAQAFELDEAGWRQLTWRWGLFFLALAVLNEAVWRNASTAFWVGFKLWGVIPLIFLFALAQTPLVMKHHIEPEKSAD